MPREPFGRDPLPRREAAAVTRHGIKEYQRGLAARSGRGGHQGGPDDVNAAATVYAHGGPILRAAIEHPLILAHAKRLREGASAVSRHRERNIPNVARVHVTPRRIDGTVRPRGERRLAAVADTAS